MYITNTTVIIVGIHKITDQNDVNKIYSDFEEAFIQTVDKRPSKAKKTMSKSSTIYK
jgi:hypothetical protein